MLWWQWNTNSLHVVALHFFQFSYQFNVVTVLGLETKTTRWGSQKDCVDLKHLSLSAQSQCHAWTSSFDMSLDLLFIYCTAMFSVRFRVFIYALIFCLQRMRLESVGTEMMEMPIIPPVCWSLCSCTDGVYSLLETRAEGCSVSVIDFRGPRNQNHLSTSTVVQQKAGEPPDTRDWLMSFGAFWERQKNSHFSDLFLKISRHF